MRDLSCLAALLAGFAVELRATDLDDYVRRPDDSYRWQAFDAKPVGDLASVTRIELTSQTWRGGPWQHDLFVAVPRRVRNPSVAFLLIAAGTDTNSQRIVEECATRGGALAALLTGVPNQPLCDGRREDELIAYTFDQYLRTGDPSWPLLLPMVKSTVRAMDAVQDWAGTARGQRIDRFVVAGLSKRAWTTWLVAAADPRVCAIAPMAFDMLNMKAQTDWAAKVYGRQSEQIHNYTDMGLVEQMDTPGMIGLMASVDPYSYLDRYTMPKLVLLGTNDRYWTVDSLRHYWAGLPGPKLLFQAPNNGHNVGGNPGTVAVLSAFFRMIADGQPLPSLSWRMADGTRPSVAVKTDVPARRATLWTARSATRDFRDARWTSADMPLTADRLRASARVQRPEFGYTAFLAELTYGSEEGEHRLSTQAQVTPDD